MINTKISTRTEILGSQEGLAPPPKKNLSVISEILLFCKLWLLLHLFIRAGPKTKSCISVFGSQRSSQKKLCNFHPSKNIRQFTHPILINVTTNFKWKKTRFYSRGSDPRSFVKKCSFDYFNRFMYYQKKLLMNYFILDLGFLLVCNKL